MQHPAKGIQQANQTSPSEPTMQALSKQARSKGEGRIPGLENTITLHPNNSFKKGDDKKKYSVKENYSKVSCKMYFMQAS